MVQTYLISTLITGNLRRYFSPNTSQFTSFFYIKREYLVFSLVTLLKYLLFRRQQIRDSHLHGTFQCQFPLYWSTSPSIKYRKDSQNGKEQYVEWAKIIYGSREAQFDNSFLEGTLEVNVIVYDTKQIIIQR